MDYILKRYIEKVLEIQDKKDALSESELREIAKEIGLSDEDLKEIDNQIVAGSQRADGFMAHAIWDDAIAEWKQVLVLSPNRKNVRAKLANCYLHINEFDLARTCAEETLKTDPSNAIAFQVLAELQKRPSKNKSVLFVIVGLLVVVLAIVGVGLAMFLFTTSAADSPSSSKSTRSFSSNATPKPIKNIPKKFGTFPIEVELPPGLEFEEHISKYDVYEDSAFYTLVGKIKNKTALEISEIQGILTFTLEDGSSFQKNVEIHEDHNASLRPGDFAHFDALEKVSKSTLKSVSLKAGILTSTPAVDSYPESKSVPFNWGKGVSRTQYKLAIFERTQSLGATSSFGQYHRATWEFQNLGQTIRGLKMGIRYFSKENEELADNFFYVSSSSAAPLTPNEVRVANTIEGLPPGKFDHYKLRVIEIK